MEDYYKILELRPGASQAEIKRAYFRLVRSVFRRSAGHMST